MLGAIAATTAQICWARMMTSRIDAVQSDGSVPGIYVRGTGDVPSGFYPMPAGSCHPIYDACKNVDGVVVHSATGGMHSIEGFYKRFSSKEFRPHHFSEWSRGKTERNEAMRAKRWAESVGKGFPDWFMSRTGRVIHFDCDAGSWAMSQEPSQDSFMTVYISTNPSVTIPCEGWG